ncbi:Protein Brevis radix-like 1 [Acorus calamus]|uniref:Protein Brevis radix-like 1 n=1 Tax=Acorus calamus TaxID=4465 RepID=A0AAV9D6R3_ACOCL|nr:Protein Brevis radix-like 1 [Acorus calamus]
MLTCFSCLNTKEAIKDITNHASRGHKHPKPTTSSAKNDTETATTAAAITEETTKKWVAEVEPGVLITFVSLPNGGNHLKRIRFRTQSQESIEVQRSNGSLRTLMPGVLTGESSADGSTTMSNGNSQGDVIEWVQEYESGVFVTVRSYPDGTRELRRVELSRDRFGEVKARVWWEENKERLHREYS